MTKKQQKRPSTLLQVLKKRDQVSKTYDRLFKLQDELKDLEENYPRCRNVLVSVDEPKYAGTYVVNAYDDGVGINTKAVLDAKKVAWEGEEA